VPIIGTVGAGAQVVPVDDLPLIPKLIADTEREYINCEWVDAPPGVADEGIVALKIKGDSMMPYMRDGSIVYYSDRFLGGAPDQCLDRLCVVQIGDGATFVKIVERSQLHGKFDLKSYNFHTMRDVTLAWCAPVIFIKPA